MAERRLAALRGYLTDRDQQVCVEAARRWIELRIGQLAPPPEHGGDRRSEEFQEASAPLEIDRVPDRRLAEFRLMAAHPEIVERAIGSRMGETYVGDSRGRGRN